MENLSLAAVLSAAALALVHVVTPSLRFLAVTPRSAWLSFAGGVSVAYVFVHLLPELAAGQAAVARSQALDPVPFAERHVYLIALAGLLAFYGVDRFAKLSRPLGAEGGLGVFWVHIASFAAYNALVGYLILHRNETAPWDLAFYAFAMGLHFVVTDYGLDEHHAQPYRRLGRWILAAAVLAGFGAGAATEMPEAAVAVLLAFLGGGVILNVLKEEVPSERQSRFGAFAAGAAGYAALLLAV